MKAEPTEIAITYQTATKSAMYWENLSIATSEKKVSWNSWIILSPKAEMSGKQYLSMTIYVYWHGLISINLT